MAFEDVATLLIVLEAEDRATEKIDRERRAIEELSAAIDAAAADMAGASASMDADMASTAAEAEALKHAVDDQHDSWQRLAEGNLLHGGWVRLSEGELPAVVDGLQQTDEKIREVTTGANTLDTALHDAAGGMDISREGAQAYQRALTEVDSRQYSVGSTAAEYRSHLIELADEEQRVRDAVDEFNLALGLNGQSFEDGDQHARAFAEAVGVDFERFEALRHSLTAGTGEVENAERAMAESARTVEDAGKAAKDAETGWRDTATIMGELAQATETATKRLNEASNSADRFGRSARRAGGYTTYWAHMVHLVVLAIAALSGPIEGLLALSVPGVFMAIGLAANSMYHSITQAQQSGEQLTEVQKALLPTVTVLHNDFAALNPVIQQTAVNFAHVMSSLGPQFTQAIQGLGPIIHTLGDGFAQVIAILVRGFAPLMSQVQPVVAALTGGLETLTRAFVSLIQGINFADAAQGLTDLFNALGQLVALLGGVLRAFTPLSHQILGTLVPAIVTLTQAVLGALEPAMRALLPPLAQFLTTLGAQLVPVVTAVTPGLLALATSLGRILTALTPLLPPLAQLITGMLPRFMSVLNALVGLLPPLVTALTAILTPIVTWISANPRLTQSLGAVLAGWLAWRVALSPLYGLLGNLVRAIIGIPGKVMDLVGKFRDLISTIASLPSKIVSLVGKIKDLGSAVLGGVQSIANFAKTLGTLAASLGSNIVSGLKSFGAALLDIGKALGGALISGIRALGTVIMESVIPALVEAAIATWSFTVALLANPITWIVIAIVALVTAIVLLVTHWKQVSEFLTGAWNAFLSWSKGIWNDLASFFAGLWNNVSHFFRTVWNSIVSFLTSLWNDEIAGWKTIWDGLKEFFTGLWNDVSAFVRGVWNGIVGFFQGIWNTITSLFRNAGDSVRNIWNDVINWFRNIPTWIMNIFSNAGNWLLSAGQDIISGLWQGIQRAVGWLMGQIQHLGSQIVGAFKNFFNIGSPSKLMADEIGRFIPEGIAAGILANTGVIATAAQAATQHAVVGAHIGLTTPGGLSALPPGNQGAQINLVFQGNQLMSDRDMDTFVAKVGRALATQILPQAGIQIRM